MTDRAAVPVRLDYVELPVADAEISARFFEAAFGWTLARFGPSYAATTTGDVDLGLHGDASDASAAPLAIVNVSDLDAALAAVIAAGGEVTRAPFDFPGGRRFHFREPGGCELAAWTPA